MNSAARVETPAPACPTQNPLPADGRRDTKRPVQLSDILPALAALSVLLLAWQLIVAARFKLHRRVRAKDFAPGISILKPLKGCDAETRECLQSWMRQDYEGSLQILFGVRSMDDPVCALVKELLAENSGCQAQLIVCPEAIGSNAKVSTLAQLEPFAWHEVLCVSDADVHAPADFLSCAAAPLRWRDVGLVNCFYRFANPVGIGMRWEAFAVNADFWGQVLQARSLRPMDFGLGAAMLLHRDRLARVGGFGELAHFAADDYHLGRRLAHDGGRIVLTSVVVQCRTAPMSFSGTWAHQQRWARIIRVCRPVGYFFSIFGNATFWPLLWLVCVPSKISVAGAIACWTFRMIAGIWLERKMTGTLHPGSAGFALMKDVLQLAIWTFAFTSRHIKWAGTDYEMDRDGRLATGSPKKPAGASRLKE